MVSASVLLDELESQKQPFKVEETIHQHHSPAHSIASWWCRARNAIFTLLLFSLSARLLHLKSTSSRLFPQKTDIVNGITGTTERLSWNGTHWFNKTVIMVSIDGFRNDYLDRGLTPHLLDISKSGIRAEHMKPIFPSVTFPNHWTLLTGLYAESHGIVANEFWDPVTKQDFVYNDPKRSLNASWWGGEPIWATLEEAGIKTANLMWIGPIETLSGARCTYREPWRNHVPLAEKLSQVMEWLDHPVESRPQLILVYEPSLDQVGHSNGPDAPSVNVALTEVDLFAYNLHQSLATRNLTDFVDIIFVSDHGMADTENPEWVFLEDFIGIEGVEQIAHQDGWPLMGLSFKSGVDELNYIRKLEAAAELHPEKFDVYTHETMPKRYHFSNNLRISPVYVVPKLGYALTGKRKAGLFFVKGNHGYDNELPDMQAMFIAHGPFAQTVKRLLNTSALWNSPTVIEGFANVEVKSLISRLLDVGIRDDSHNGTIGFWDKYIKVQHAHK